MSLEQRPASESYRGPTGPTNTRIMKERHVSLLGLEFTAVMDANQAGRLTQSPWWRYLVRPSLRLLERSADQRPPAPRAQLPVPARTVATPEGTPALKEVLDRIARVPWYQTIEVIPGVVTPGYVDHREQIGLYGLPEDMRGMRALDVATYDGFWAFEMERRGAEVVAIDLESLADCDYPRRFRHHARAATNDQKTGQAFAIAHELLDSRVKRVILSVYDLSPERLGMFDVVFVSDLLLHLRDAARALESTCSVTKETGYTILAEPYNVELEAFRDIPLSRFGFAEAVGWWQHSAATLKTMMWAAGYDRIDEVSRFRLNCNAAIPLEKVVLRGYPGLVAPEVNGARAQSGSA